MRPRGSIPAAPTTLAMATAHAFATLGLDAVHDRLVAQLLGRQAGGVAAAGLRAGDVDEALGPETLVRDLVALGDAGCRRPGGGNRSDIRSGAARSPRARPGDGPPPRRWKHWRGRSGSGSTAGQPVSRSSTIRHCVRVRDGKARNAAIAESESARMPGGPLEGGPQFVIRHPWSRVGGLSVAPSVIDSDHSATDHPAPTLA